MPRLWHLIWPLRRQRVGPRRIGSQVDGQEANFLAVRSPESWFMMCGNHGNLKKISDIMSNYWGAYIYILYIYIYVQVPFASPTRYSPVHPRILGSATLMDEFSSF
jgi:hypothetical protein